MPKDIKLFEWLSELQDEFGFPKKRKPQNYVVNLGKIDMGEADESMETDGKCQAQNKNEEQGSTRMLTRQGKKLQDALNKTIKDEESGEANAANNSFDSDKLDEESIGSTDSESPFKLSKFAQILNCHRDIHNNFEKNGRGHYLTASYSISASEVLLRYDNKPLMGSLPVRKDKSIEFLIRSALYQSYNSFLTFFGSMGKYTKYSEYDEDEAIVATRQEARVLIKNIIADPRMTCDAPAVLSLDLFHAYFSLLLDLPYLDHLKVRPLVKTTLGG